MAHSGKEGNESADGWVGHLKGYYREGGRGSGSLIIDTYGVADDDRGEGSMKERQPTDMELMREKFAKLLLGEDMSGGGKGVSSAMALSNAITNLAASVFGEQKRLEPMSEETKARWKKEIDWLLSITDYIVEFVPTKQRLRDGGFAEVMVTRQRRDLYLNIPALRKLDAMLLDCLDNFQDQNEFYYGSKNADSPEGKNSRQDDKWWIPTPTVPPNGLSDATRKWFLQQKDSVNQVLKAAMAINSLVLSEMEIPESYIESLPKNGRVSLGDALYKSITDEHFSPDDFLSHLDCSLEHKVLDLKNKLEASVVIWKKKLNAKDKPSWGSVLWIEKRDVVERAETLLILLKHKCPGLPQSDLDICKIQCNRDVGFAVLESYSRVIEGLAFTVLSRIEDVMHADSLARKAASDKDKSSFEEAVLDNSLDKPQDVAEVEDSPETTPSSMTLMDFIGWSLVDGEEEEEEEETKTEVKKETPKVTKKLGPHSGHNSFNNLSYTQRLESLGGSRSPTPRD